MTTPPTGETGTGDAGLRLTPTRRRRELPYLVVGVALVVTGALATVNLTSRLGDRVDVLVLARDVPVGQPVSAADLRVEQVMDGSSIPTVREADAASVVGKVAAVPLRAGRLLAADDVGAPAWPTGGQVVVAVALAPGAYPPELAAGMHVLAGAGSADGAAALTDGAGGAAGGGLQGAPEAVVASVRDNPAGTGGIVASLLFTRDGAGRVTAIPASRLRLVVVPAPTASPEQAPPAAPSSPAPGSSDGG